MTPYNISFILSAVNSSASILTIEPSILNDGGSPTVKCISEALTSMALLKSLNINPKPFIISPYLTAEPILNTGKYIAMINPPTNTPNTDIMSGSVMLVIASTASSTSSS